MIRVRIFQVEAAETVPDMLASLNGQTNIMSIRAMTDERESQIPLRAP